MKVVCIDDAKHADHTDYLVALNGFVVYGETYTVLRVVKCRYYGEAYILAEKPSVGILPGLPPYEAGWKKQRFVTPEHFEMEFKERKEETCPSE